MKKAFTLFMVLILLLSLVVSCSPDDTTTGSTEDTTDETTSDILNDNLPSNLDFDEETITILSRDSSWFADEISVEENAATTISSAVYNRLLKVEDRLNVDIVNDKVTVKSYAEIADIIRKNYLVNDNTYDLAANGMYHTMDTGSEGIFWNLYDVPYLNFEMPWYSQNFVEEATIGDALYFITGDAALSYMRLVFVTFFNKQVVSDYYSDIDMYQLVLNGEWTYDKQYEMVAGIYDDLNHNNKADEGDLFGLGTNTVTGVDPYWSAFDLPILGRDEFNYPVIGVDVEKTYDAIDMINDLFWDNTGTYIYAHQSSDGEYETMMTDLASDRLAFTTLRLISVESSYLTDMESEYGIIPMPKYDSDQAEYQSFCHDQLTVFGIPANVSESKLEVIGATLEAFFSESYNSVRPKYYEIALKGRYLRDEESSVMLDMIIDGLTLDAGWIYSKNLVDFPLVMRTLVQAKSSSFTKVYEARLPSFTIALDTLIDAYLANE